MIRTLLFTLNILQEMRRQLLAAETELLKKNAITQLQTAACRHKCEDTHI